jgi:hypothetical protein
MAFTYNPGADQIAKQALQLCGLLPLGRVPKPDMLNDARDLLTMILKQLQARGVTLTQAPRLTLPVLAGTATYTLPADIIDVEFPTTIAKVGDENDNWVERMVYSDYQTISNKTTTGQPTRAYVEKLATLSVIFWPVPDVDYTWNYRGIRLIVDMDSGLVTMGLTQKWLGAIAWRLAYWLAHAYNLPAQKRMELQAEANSQEALVMGQENERGDLQMMLPPNPYGSY